MGRRSHQSSVAQYALRNLGEAAVSRIARRIQNRLAARFGGISGILGRRPDEFELRDFETAPRGFNPFGTTALQADRHFQLTDVRAREQNMAVKRRRSSWCFFVWVNHRRQALIDQADRRSEVHLHTSANQPSPADRQRWHNLLRNPDFAAGGDLPHETVVGGRRSDPPGFRRSHRRCFRPRQPVKRGWRARRGTLAGGAATRDKGSPGQSCRNEPRKLGHSRKLEHFEPISRTNRGLTHAHGTPRTAKAALPSPLRSGARPKRRGRDSNPRESLRPLLA